MKAGALVQPTSSDEIQLLRKLARDPRFREKAVEIVGLIRASRDQVQEFAEKRRAELTYAEQALGVANDRLREAEAVLSELHA